MPDGVISQIQDIRKQLFVLTGYLSEGLEQQQRQAADWLVEEIEVKLAQIEKICQTSPKP